MMKFILVVLAIAGGFVALTIGALIGAFFFWLIWNSTVSELFPRAVAYVPATVTLWQAFKLMFFLGTIGRSFRSDVKVETK